LKQGNFLSSDLLSFYGSLPDALELRERELISLVGAGGKTSLMFSLAKELQDRRKKVITTTTTKIFYPQTEESPKIILGGASAFKKIEGGLDRFKHITWAAETNVDNKLRGVSMADLSAVWSTGVADYMIVEADGSARKPVKAPGENEPAVPQETTLFISVLGLSALGRPLTGEFAFRPEGISVLTGLAMNSLMTGDALARLLVHPQGGLKGFRPSMRALIFLNQSDKAPSPQPVLQLARAVKEKGGVIISRIIVSQLKHPTEGSPSLAALPSLLVL
jgi:probable selenium-dependent hydroxylase accessory protein YqeC